MSCPVGFRSTESWTAVHEQRAACGTDGLRVVAGIEAQRHVPQAVRVDPRANWVVYQQQGSYRLKSSGAEGIGV